MDASTFLDTAKPPKPQPVYVLAGDERFFRPLVLQRIQEIVLGGEPDELSRTVYQGDSADYAAVMDDLRTRPFLSPQRLVIVQDADSFVTEYRKRLEDYVAHPSSVGVLVLDVKTWLPKTNLGKVIPDEAIIQCTAIKAAALPGWCRHWCRRAHGKQLTADAAALLVDLVGEEMGVLAQELAKLAVYVGERERIGPNDVDALVGHSRVETVWKMLDALAVGQPAKALTVLQQLIAQGEEPIGLIGAMSWQLRKLAQLYRLSRLGTPLGAAMNQLGVPPFNRRRFEAHLRQLGPKAGQLFDWLLQADLALKSTDALPAHILLERMLIRLSS